MPRIVTPLFDMVASIETNTTARDVLPQVLGAEPAAPRRRTGLSALGRDGWRTVGSLLDQGIVSGASFGTSLLIGRFGSPEDLGVFFLVLSGVLFVRGIQEQLITAPYVVYAARRQGRSLASYTGSALLHQAAFLAVVVLAVVSLLVALRLSGQATRLISCLAVLLYAAPFLLTRETVRLMTFARLQVGSVVLIDGLAAVVQLGCLALLAAGGWLTPQAALAVMGLACALACVAWWWRRPELEFGLAAARQDWQQNWSFGKWTLSSHLLGMTSPQLLPWFLAATHGEAAAGLLAAVLSVVGLSNVVTGGISNFLAPRAAGAYAQHGVAALRRVLWQAATVFVALLGPLCIAAWFAGDWITESLYGSQYAGAGLVLSILMLNALVNSLGMVAGLGLWAVDRPRGNFIADCLSLPATLATAVLFVPAHGICGVAVASLAGTAAATFARAWVFDQSLRGNFLQPAPADGASAP